MNESPARSEIVGKRDPEAAKASGTPPRNGPTPVEPAVQLRPEMADVARAVMPERAVASGVEAKPPVLGANAPAGNEGKRIAPKSTVPIFTRVVDADHAARAESIARTASKARAPVRPLDRGDVLMPSVRDVRSVTPKVSVPLGPVLSADSVRSDSADPAVLRGQAVSPNPSPAEPQVPSSGRQFHPVTTDASVLGAVEPNGRARKTPEVVAPTIAVPKRGSVTVPPPSEDAFLPTDAAQNRAVRAVEVLSALRMGEIPESAARVSEPPKPETAAVAIRVRDPVRMELPIDKAEKAGPTRLTAANVELTTFGREPVADRATPAERVVSSGHLRTEQSTVPPSAAMEGTPPAGIATDSVAAAPTRSPIEAPVALREQVAHQIVRQVRHVVTGGEQTVAIKLVPESLGELHISVTSSKDVLEIVLTSSSRHVRQTLEQQLHALRETLIREGIDVTRATIASPVTTDNELQGSFTRAGNGQHAGTERQGSNQPWSGSSHRDPDLANPDKRSGNSHHGKLNVFA